MMSSKAVIGLGYGDEGKGVVTEYLCSQDPINTLVVRFSGGPQAGHKVIKENTEHVFSSFGSGTLSGCPTYWSQFCSFDPVACANELHTLHQKDIKPHLFLHPECPVITIYDVFVNRSSVERQHGTCGSGMFRTKKRHYCDGLSFTVEDLFGWSSSKIKQKLEKIRRYYGADRLNEDVFMESLVHLYQTCILENPVPYYKHLVFEGSQGLMLDETIGTMPHCTPTDVTPRNAMYWGTLDKVYLITRAYQTRHGNGPMTNEHLPVALKNTEKETNVYNPYQGHFRTSVLDLDQLIHAKIKGIDTIVPTKTKVNLVVTCLDQLSKYKVTHHGVVKAFDDPESFVRFLGEHLKIDHEIYVNDGPLSTSIRLL